MKKTLILSVILIVLLPSFASALPDITITDLTIDTDNPKMGDSIEMTITFVNIGDAEFDRAEFYVSANGNDYVSDLRTFGPILADGNEYQFDSSFDSLNYDVTMTSGENTITVKADLNNRVEESDKTNNEKSITFNLGQSDEFCSDGTRVGECSEDKPKFCYKYNDVLNLVDKSKYCGCDDGYESKWDECYEIYVDTCTKIYTCPGGTEIEECFPTSSESGAPCYCNDDPEKTCSIMEAPSIDDCPEYYTCDDGSQVEWCKSFSSANSAGCGCAEFPEKECPGYEEPKSEPCLKYYTCPDGSQVIECEPFSTESTCEDGASGCAGGGGGCGCKANPEELCNYIDEDKSSQSSTQEQVKKEIKEITNSEDILAALKTRYENVERIEPTQEGEAYRYKVTEKKQGKFLGLFNIDVDFEAEINSETGEVIKINQPWWTIFVI